MQNERTWKIPVTLTDMKTRADNIGGEIKQADANIVEAKKRLALAQEAQRVAERAVTSAEEIARDRREERDALAQAMAAHIYSLGEVPPVSPTALEEASVKADQFWGGDAGGSMEAGR
jgi:hypothetical protein